MNTTMPHAISSRFATLVVSTLAALSCIKAHSTESETQIVPGAPWHDEAGALIQAHGGGVLKHADIWYFYGEDKRNGYYPSPGVSCYSSKDLVHWRNEGVVCPMWVQDGQSIVPNTPTKFQSGTKRPVIERPKVVYNERTGKFVMWMHLEGYVGDPAVKYQVSSAGVAVSDTPEGPFEFVNFLRPIPPQLHKRYSDATAADQFERGSTFRDMNLFKDDDGSAYVVYAAEDNYTMHIIALTDDYLSVQEPVPDQTWARVLVLEHREAPALFKHAGKYHLITSGATGWTPNEARLSVAETVFGPYASLGNPCRGKKAGTTFDSQSTFVLPIDPEKGRFVFMADRWVSESIGESTYVWLPFSIKPGGNPVIQWMDCWTLSCLDPEDIHVNKAMNH